MCMCVCTPCPESWLLNTSQHTTAPTYTTPISSRFLRTLSWKTLMFSLLNGVLQAPSCLRTSPYPEMLPFILLSTFYPWSFRSSPGMRMWQSEMSGGNYCWTLVSVANLWLQFKHDLTNGPAFHSINSFPICLFSWYHTHDVKLLVSHKLHSLN